MSATDRGRFVAIETEASRYLMPNRLTLRFCDEDYDKAAVLRIGFATNYEDKEVCWLNRRQAEELLKELRAEYGDA